MLPSFLLQFLVQIDPKSPISNPNKEFHMEKANKCLCMVRHGSLDSNATLKHKQNSLILTSSKKSEIGRSKR